jgi:hypothetical protein
MRRCRAARWRRGLGRRPRARGDGRAGRCGKGQDEGPAPGQKLWLVLEDEPERGIRRQAPLDVLTFTLRFRPSDILQWAEAYSYPGEDQIVAELAPRARARGYLTKAEFLTLCRWKTPRSQSRCARNSTTQIPRGHADRPGDRRRARQDVNRAEPSWRGVPNGLGDPPLSVTGGRTRSSIIGRCGRWASPGLRSTPSSSGGHTPSSPDGSRDRLGAIRERSIGRYGVLEETPEDKAVTMGGSLATRPESNVTTTRAGDADSGRVRF